MAQRVALFHAALPFKGGIHLQKAEVHDTAVIVTQGLAKKERLLHAFEHGAPALAACAQRGIHHVAFNGQRGAARHHRDRVDIVGGWQAHDAVVVREHAQQAAVGRFDRCGPAGSQAMRKRQVTPILPVGVRGNIVHIYRVAGVGSRAPRGYVGSDGRALQRRAEFRRQARRGVVDQIVSGLVDQCDRRAQLGAGLGFDGVQNVFEHMRQRHTGRYALQHDPFFLQTGERIGPRVGYAILLFQHVCPFSCVYCIAGPRLDAETQGNATLPFLPRLHRQGAKRLGLVHQHALFARACAVVLDTPVWPLLPSAEYARPAGRSIG
ncbi:hypothetical protein D3C73_800500 [compost metagenome]